MMSPTIPLLFLFLLDFHSTSQPTYCKTCNSFNMSSHSTVTLTYSYCLTTPHIHIKSTCLPHTFICFNYQLYSLHTVSTLCLYLRKKKNYSFTTYLFRACPSIHLSYIQRLILYLCTRKRQSVTDLLIPSLTHSLSDGVQVINWPPSVGK